MVRPERSEDRLAPIFIIADDNREAIELIQRMLNVEWYYIALWETRLVVRYARHFATTAVFLADPIGYPDGGAARLLQELLDQVGKPIVILSELWSPETAAKWKRMGAADCIPHPTRFDERMEGLRLKMQEFALNGPARAQVPDRVDRGRSQTVTTYFGA
jgi:DNA-binding NtrC family response regulator